MYIVEGMDGAGKTTLAVRLACTLQGMLLTNKRKPKWSNHLIQQIRIANEVQHNLPVVLDRISLISEPVYSTLRDTKFKADLFPYLWKSVHDPVVIYVRPPFESLVLGGDQMEGVVENARSLYDAYDRVISELPDYIKVITYDRTTMSYDELLEKINA